jgi:rhamnosyltransferase
MTICATDGAVMRGRRYRWLGVGRAAMHDGDSMTAMQAAPRAGTGPGEATGISLATITVTYVPDIAIVARQLAGLPRDALRVIVDNGSDASLVEQLAQLARDENAVLLPNGRNLGLAAGLNIGIAYAREAQCSRVLLLDQDSEPDAGAVTSLCNAFDALQASGVRPGCVGPAIVDIETGLEHGFHAFRGLRPVRIHGAGTDPVRCIGLNGSGLLFEIRLADELGGFDESLFIDHVDTDWSFRVGASGYGLFGVPRARFRHRMGARSIRFWWLRWRVWPYRTPARHRQLFRNAIRLMRRPYAPAVWKCWAVVKLAATLSVHLLFDAKRFEQAAAMLRGVRDGLRADARGTNVSERGGHRRGAHD